MCREGGLLNEKIQFSFCDWSGRQKNLLQREKVLWGEKDSNLRRLSQQIYSLPPLTTRVPPHLRVKNSKYAAACQDDSRCSDRPFAPLLLPAKTDNTSVVPRNLPAVPVHVFEIDGEILLEKIGHTTVARW